MNYNAVKTYWVEICMAGSIEKAKEICREYCYDVGLCVTIDPTLYIYTGGEEHGFKVRLINYPRFPDTDASIYSKALELGYKLRIGLYQDSYTIITPTNTYWFSRRDK